MSVSLGTSNASHVLAAEGRLYHRPRSAPRVTVTNDQPVAQQHLYTLEPGDDQRDELVKQFVVAEYPALLVGCVHVHRQEIVGLDVSGNAPRFDDLQQQAPEVACFHDHAQVARRIAREKRKRILAL
jgi:hypothetical protein